MAAWFERRRCPDLGVALLLGASLAACATSWGRGAARDVPSPRERVWEYRVVAAPGARELRVEAELPAGVPEELGVDVFADPFVSDVQIATERGWQSLARTGTRWRAPRCRSEGCSLRYRYHLGEAAERINRFAYAGYRAGALLAPPSTFLLAPQDYAGSDRYRFSVAMPPGESFVTGVWRDPSGKGHAALASVLFQAPYSGFGRFEHERLVIGASPGVGAADEAPRSVRVGGERTHDEATRDGAEPGDGHESAPAMIALALAPGELALRVSRDGLRRAVRQAAANVSSYYGRFPVPEVTLIVLPTPGASTAGMQLGNGGATIVFFLGAGVDDAALARDWVLTHELFHLGFPTLRRRHLWLAEGLATYQGPIARARAGSIDERELWRQFLDGMPNGLPLANDGGLDGNPRWGRTYWGGALFCLLLDVELRARTDNRLSLDAAARAILRAGGDTSVRWSAARTLAAGDAALDRPSLSELYAEHATAPVPIDLAGLLRRLGVRREGQEVAFDDRAELAHVRRAIAGR